MIFDFRLTIAGGLGLVDGSSNSSQDIAHRAPTSYFTLHTSYLLLTWLLIPIITFLWFPVRPELHYMLPVYPVGYILAGLAVERLSDQNLQWGLVGLVGITAGFFAYANLNMLRFLDQNNTVGGFGEPVYVQLDTVAEIEKQMGPAGAGEVIIISDGTDPLIDSDAAIYDFHLRNMPRRFVDGDHTALFPAENSVVLITNSNLPTIPIYADRTRPVWMGDSRTGLGPMVFALDGGILPKPITLFEPEPLLGNFVSLLGYVSPDSAKPTRLIWRTGEAFQPDYHLTNQLFGPEGNRVGQADIAAFPPSQWRPGDIVVSLFETDTPADAEPAKMVFGMYIYPTGDAVPVLDAAANPAGDFVEIDLR